MEKFVQSIYAGMDDQSYPYRVLDEYINYFRLERAHFAGLDENNCALINESMGWEKLPSLYENFKEYDIWKPEKTPVIYGAISLNIDIKTHQYLATINPLYENINKHVKKLCLLSSIHTNFCALVGFRFDHDFTGTELVKHSLISTMISTAYYQHKKFMKYRDITAILGSMVTGDRPFAMTDEQGNIIYAHPDFIAELILRGTDPAMLKSKLASFNRRDIIVSHGIRESFTIEELSASVDLRIETVINNGNIHYLITIHEKINVQLTPAEMKVFGLVSQGFSNREISEQLNISTETVKRHIYKLFQKTGARNRTELSHIKL